MKMIIEATPKEIAALVLELQGRQMLVNIGEMELDDLGIKLCSDDILKNE